MINAFNESKHELWFFSVSRPRKQHLLHYIFRCIQQQKEMSR